jgi:hypothetical protein
VADGHPADVLASPDLDQYGLDPTRYTQAARLATEARTRKSSRPLPVTLDQAVDYFK